MPGENDLALNIGAEPEGSPIVHDDLDALWVEPPSTAPPPPPDPRMAEMEAKLAAAEQRIASYERPAERGPDPMMAAFLQESRENRAQMLELTRTVAQIAQRGNAPAPAAQKPLTQEEEIEAFQRMGPVAFTKAILAGELNVRLPNINNASAAEIRKLSESNTSSGQVMATVLNDLQIKNAQSDMTADIQRRGEKLGLEDSEIKALKQEALDYLEDNARYVADHYFTTVGDRDKRMGGAVGRRLHELVDKIFYEQSRLDGFVSKAGSRLEAQRAKKTAGTFQMPTSGHGMTPHGGVAGPSSSDRLFASVKRLSGR